MKEEFVIARLLLVADGMVTLLNALSQEPSISQKYGNLIKESLREWKQQYPAEYTISIHKEPKPSKEAEINNRIEEILLFLNQSGPARAFVIADHLDLTLNKVYYALTKAPVSRSGDLYSANRVSALWKAELGDPKLNAA